MTRRVTISLPDDVAAQLDAVPDRQVSAYVADALRRRRASDEIRAALSAAGHRDYPYEPAVSARRLTEQRVAPQVREAAVLRFAEASGRSVDEVRAELDRRAAG